MRLAENVLILLKSFLIEKKKHNLIYGVTVLHLYVGAKSGGKKAWRGWAYWLVLLMANTFEKLLTVESLYHLSFFFQDDSGYINFREYLIGLALVSQPANSEEAMQLAFQVRNYTGHWQGCQMSENGQSGENSSGQGKVRDFYFESGKIWHFRARS